VGTLPPSPCRHVAAPLAAGHRDACQPFTGPERPLQGRSRPAGPGRLAAAKLLYAALAEPLWPAPLCSAAEPSLLVPGSRRPTAPQKGGLKAAVLQLPVKLKSVTQGRGRAAATAIPTEQFHGREKAGSYRSLFPLITRHPSPLLLLHGNQCDSSNAGLPAAGCSLRILCKPLKAGWLSKPVKPKSNADSVSYLTGRKTQNQETGDR